MRARRERGQAAVELALGLPLVFLALMAVVQVVLVARDQIAVLHAAREGARAAAVGDAGAGAAAARAAVGLDASRASISASEAGDRVTVVVRYRSPTDVPLIGVFLGDITVTGAATMQVEP
jgi:Flp pilus assembly protein TadG